MKAFFTTALLASSLSSFASIASLKTVLSTNEVKALEMQLNDRAFSLSSVKDVYATTGRYPRCMCSKYELTFTSAVTNPETNLNDTKTFVVNIKGMITNQTVSVQEVSGNLD